MRNIICEDALVWLEKSPVLHGHSIIASLPDISEFPNMPLEEWKGWFIQTAALVLSRTPPEGVTVFYQSDIKREGVWIDKSYLVQKAAEQVGHELLWHKIVCRVGAGLATRGRPAYSHMLCFSQEVRPDMNRALPDVLPEVGDKTWERGMGLEACRTIARFIATQTTTKTIVHPFCGEGSMLAVAEEFQLSGIGIERSLKRAEKARRLKVAHNERGPYFYLDESVTISSVIK